MKNILKTALILFLLLILACCDSSSNSTTKVINKKLISGIETGSIGLFQTSSEYTVEGLLDSISYNEDGTCIFSNIVYESSNPFKYISNHLIWTLELSYKYKITSDTELKNSLKTIIPKLVEYWVKNDLQDTNWWYNVINTPNLLGEIVLLAGDTLSDELLSDTLKIMERGCFTKGCKASNYSGANGAWIAYSTLKYGLITGDETLIKAAVDKAITDLSFSKGEGIKTDGSFMQHGNRFYSGSYGQSLVTNYAKIIYLTNGTDYALTQEQLKPLYELIMNGLAYISIGNIIEPQSLGREISRIGATSLEGFEKHLKLLTSLNVSSYINSITNNKRPALGLKYFDQSELIVINNPDFYFCFRGCDENLYYSEYLNDENLLSYNSSFGTTTTIAGKTVDFDSLQPVQDFSLIPGTTAVYETDDQLNSHDKAYSTRKLSGTFGGKLLSDTSAVSFVQSKHEGIGYTVACFATDKSALLMGAGLASNDDSKMITTLQQELAQGNYSDSGNTVIHNGVKYIKYSGGEMEAKKESKTGTWGRNKISVDERYAVEYTKDVFTLTIQNTGSYAYAVMGENTNEKYEVIVNSDSVQAVIMPDGSLCAVFYKDTSFDYGGTTYSGSPGTVLNQSLSLDSPLKRQLKLYN